MTTIKIKVTREILEKSAYCDLSKVGENCAIALAVRDVLPMANVGSSSIYPFGTGTRQHCLMEIQLPELAQNFITAFDRNSPLCRLEFPEVEFDVEVPDDVLEMIAPIEELKKQLFNHPTLQLV